MAWSFNSVTSFQRFFKFQWHLKQRLSMFKVLQQINLLVYIVNVLLLISTIAFFAFSRNYIQVVEKYFPFPGNTKYWYLHLSHVNFCRSILFHFLHFVRCFASFSSSLFFVHLLFDVVLIICMKGSQSIPLQM